MENARIKISPEKAKMFCLAGKAIFTLKNEESGNRFTYRIKKLKDTPWFVHVLTGKDNGSSYSYIGTIFNDKKFHHGKKSKISEDAGSVKVFKWFFKTLFSDTFPGTVSIYHEGRCGRCGRRLTVPESIISGFGPYCDGRVNDKWKK